MKTDMTGNTGMIANKGQQSLISVLLFITKFSSGVSRE
jgi:hypothetical protein